MSRAEYMAKYYQDHKEKLLDKAKTEGRKVWSRRYYLANKQKVLDCNRNAYYKRVYGITQADYTTMLTAQGGCCKLCGLPEMKASKRLAVDHCHTTGKVRGLLCLDCNTGLGKFRDSPDLLLKAVNYLNEVCGS